MSVCVACVPQVSDFEKCYFGSVRNFIANLGHSIFHGNAHYSCSGDNADGQNFRALSCKCRQISVRVDLKLI